MNGRRAAQVQLHSTKCFSQGSQVGQDGENIDGETFWEVGQCTAL
jgi:hypothetical protein